MNRSGFRFLIVVGLSAVAASAAAQVPVYLPPAPAEAVPPPSVTAPSTSAPSYSPPVTFPPASTRPVISGPANYTPPAAVVDPSPVYPPAVPNLSYAQPSYGPASSMPQQATQPPFYRPVNPPYSAAPTNAAPDYSQLPGYGGPNSGMPFAQPNPNAGGAIPYGSFDRGNFSGGPQMPPGPTSQWTPNYGAPFGGAAQGGYGQAGCIPGGGCETGCAKCYPGCWFDNFSVISSVDAFKTPVDLDGLNGNFGKRVGVSAAGPIYAPWGLGAQFSGTAGWYDPKGTLYTGDETRFQNFWTVGVFHRSCTTGIGIGLAYDLLFDDYWTDLQFGQWRIGGSWQMNPCNEIGVWVAMPDNRDSTTATGVNERFSSLLQGNAYYRHVWDSCGWTTVYAGLAESPSDISMGSNSQVPLNDYVALFANTAYVLPASGGTQGRQEEIWNVSVGFAFYPGSARRVATSQFRPFFDPADNGNFAAWRK